MSDKPVRLHVCTECMQVYDQFRSVCPVCLHKPMRCCHSLMCTNMVNGDVGTFCNKCRTPKVKKVKYLCKSAGCVGPNAICGKVSVFSDDKGHRCMAHGNVKCKHKVVV